MANVNQTNDYDSTERISKLLWMTIGPLVFFAGIIGNIIILIVLRRGKLSGHRTTNLYVTLIAAADLIVLLSGMVNEWLKVNTVALSDYKARTFIYISFQNTL